MTGTITIPGKSAVKFDVENMQNKETEKHIQRMIVAFLTSDTFGEDALQKCNKHSLQLMLKKKVGEEYMKWEPDMSQPYMNLSKVVSSCNNKLAQVGLRISKVRRETDGKYYYCMYSQTSDTLDSYDKEDTEEFNELFKGVVLVHMINENGVLTERAFNDIYHLTEQTGNKKGGSKIIDLLNEKFLERIIENNTAYYVVKPRMLVELSDTIRDILKKQKKKPECFRCSELVLQCRECAVCKARFHRYCVDGKCANPSCRADFDEEIINH